MALPWPSSGPFYPPLFDPDLKFQPITSIFLKRHVFVILWTCRGPILPLQTSKSGFGTIIERSGSKNYSRNTWETYDISSVVLFYDPIFEYVSNHFWLYHPGEPDHSAKIDFVLKDLFLEETIGSKFFIKNLTGGLEDKIEATS